MAEYLAPGLFIEEKSAGPAVIQGVSTSNLGMAAWTSRGPVDVATLVTSFDAFIEKFGTYWANSYAAYAMSAFFANGGSRAYFVRVVPSDAVKGSCIIEDVGQAGTWVGPPLPATIDMSTNKLVDIALDGGVSGGDIDCSGGTPAATTLAEIVSAINTALTVSACSIVQDAGGGNHLQIQSQVPGAASDVEFVAPTATDITDVIFGLDTGSYPHNFAGAAAVERWEFTAYSEGAWGNLVKVALEGDDNYTVPVTGSWSKFTMKIYEESALGEADYAVVESYGPIDLDTTSDPQYIIDVVNAASERIVVSVPSGGTPGIPWELSAKTRADEPLELGDAAETDFAGYFFYPPLVRGSVGIEDAVETFTDNGDGTLTGDATGTGTINYDTGQYTVSFNAAPGSGDIILADYVSLSAAGEATCTLTSGADGTSVSRTQVSAPALEATNQGIYAMNAIEDVINVIEPDFAGSVSVAGDLITWAEARKDRFIILDPATDLSPQEVLEYRRYTLNANTSYAALYYPWCNVTDPLSNLEYAIPPSGFVAGVFAPQVLLSWSQFAVGSEFGRIPRVY
jgi:phage tail sheath protein FI